MWHDGGWGDAVHWQLDAELGLGTQAVAVKYVKLQRVSAMH